MDKVARFGVSIEEKHPHSHSYRHLEKKRLLITIIITAIVMVVEIVGGIFSKSLALIIYFTGFYLIDPIFSILICVAILYWAFLLIRDSVRILMETTPKGINIKKMADELTRQIPELKGLHDIHIWGITDDMNYITAHAVVGDDISISEYNPMLEKINEILLHNYNIGHSTIQFETMECKPHSYNFRDAHKHSGIHK